MGMGVGVGVGMGAGAVCSQRCEVGGAGGVLEGGEVEAALWQLQIATGVGGWGLTVKVG